MSQKAAKFITKHISQLCGEPQLAVCLSRKMGPFKSHLWMSDRLEKEAQVKADCLAFGSITHMCCGSIDVAEEGSEAVNHI